MGRSRQLGLMLALGASIQMLLLVIGVMRRSYLAIAVPVVVATGIVSALAFWVGWTMMNTEPELAELEEELEIPEAVS